MIDQRVEDALCKLKTVLEILESERPSVDVGEIRVNANDLIYELGSAVGHAEEIIAILDDCGVSDD